MPTKTTCVILAAATWVALSASAAIAANGRPGQLASRDGVSVWVPREKFNGETSFVDQQGWEPLAVDQLPLPLGAEPVIGTGATVCAAESGGAGWVVYARHESRLVRRGVARAEPATENGRYRLVQNASRGGLGVEVLDADGRPHYAVRVFPSGLVELEPGRAKRLSVDEVRLAYAIEPSLIGVDLVYDPRRYAGVGRLYVPSMNLLAGLVDGGDSLMAAAWPPGDRQVELGLGSGQRTTRGLSQFLRSENGTVPFRRLVDSLSISPAQGALYFQFIEHPAIWHVEPLKAAYLEKTTVLDWKRPLEAAWIGRFLVGSEEIHYPFYFLREKKTLWGRYIRGWYDYPLWFDGDKTCVFFEKKFPPEGELLIYFLESDANRGGARSPIAVMREALGRQTADELLDFDGVDQRLLLAHGDAVCAMTNKMQKLFDDGQEVKEQDYIRWRADDVADFIGMIRQRVFEYGDFARRMSELLADRGRAYPAKTLESIEETVDEIATSAAEDLPKVSLDEVRRWTDQIKGLAGQVRPSNAKQYNALARQCRSVAGSQDDLARQLSILTIRLLETAAAEGVGSPEAAGLTQEIVARSRQILRHPTWWEPRRYHEPKSDPGIP